MSEDREKGTSADINPRPLALLWAASLLLLTPLAALGVNQTVTSLGDSGPGTLRNAVAAAGQFDTITFTVTGVINLTSGTITFDKSLTVTGPGANLLEVTRSSGTFGIFALDFVAVHISGISITNGHSDYGGAIRSFGALTLTNCVLSGNTSDNAGGAIEIEYRHTGGSGTLTTTLNGCTFSHNNAGFSSSADGFGGAISNGPLLQYGGTQVTITNCTFNNNGAPAGGGAISNARYSIAISNSTFTSNSTSSGDGGAILNSTNAGSLTVDDSTFTSNTSSNGGGGAIRNTSILNSQAVVSHCTFSGNGAGTGGAINNSGAGGMSVSACTLLNNNAGASGGAISNVNLNNNQPFGNYSAALILTNNTFFNNQAQNGGAIYNEGRGNGLQATVNMHSCTLSTNAANSGGGLLNTGTNSGNAFVRVDNNIFKTGGNGANLANTGLGTAITSDGYNLSSDVGGGFLTAVGDQINTDPNLGLLQDNGGPTKTMALLVGSPAQDKGNAGGADQRGVARPVDIASIPNASGGNGADIGAVEMSSIPSIIVTTTADHDDGVCNTDCTLREAVNASNAAPGTNTILFSNSVTGTISLLRTLGTLAVNDGVIIVGPGARVLAVSGSEDIRIFNFNSGSSTISGLTIRDGWQTTGSSGDGASHFGGAIYNHATLAVTSCAFTNNFASGSNNISPAAAGGNGQGGAIFNDASLTLTNSTFGDPDSSSSNVVGGGAGGSTTASFGTGGTGGAAQGGAVYNSGTLIATNCTFANNGAAGGGGGSDVNHFGGQGGQGSGGAIYNAGAMTVTACTISGNQGIGGNGGTGNNSFQNGNPGTGNGGLKSAGASSTIGNCIVAGNLGNHGGGLDVEGAFISNGYNLVGTADVSTGFTGTADQTGTNAALISATLGPLQNNGGDTDTLALLQGSLAIDAGKSFGLATDQRGQARTVDHPFIANASGGDGTDIGAFELQTPPLSLALAVSRLTHGPAGPFEIPLPGVECRTGGNYTIIFTFNNSLSSVGSAYISQGIGTVNSAALGSDPHQYVVSVGSIANGQDVGIGLTNVVDSFGNNVSAVNVTMGVLFGDTNADRTVNSADIAQTKSRSGQTVSTANFRSDVNADGSLNSADISLVKSRSGTALPTFPGSTTEPAGIRFNELLVTPARSRMEP